MPSSHCSAPPSSTPSPQPARAQSVRQVAPDASGTGNPYADDCWRDAAEALEALVPAIDEIYGEVCEAAEVLERLLLARPKDSGYVQRAMRAQFRAGNFDRALEHSGRLREGVPAGSDDWYEAKYYQLRCLKELDLKKARRVWEDFKLLYPDPGGEQWREEFKRLGDEISR